MRNLAETEKVYPDPEFGEEVRADWVSFLPGGYMSRLQKVETRNLQLAGTGERLMISNGYNHHNVRSPVPARKNLLFAGDSYIAPQRTLPILNIWI